MLIPRIVKIEVTNRCNSRCVFCSHQFLKPEQLMDMPIDTVKRLIAEVSRWYRADRRIPEPNDFEETTSLEDGKSYRITSTKALEATMDELSKGIRRIAMTRKEALRYRKRRRHLRIQLSGYGDPTLYPHLVEAVRYCRQKHLRSYFKTNGMLLTPTLTKQLFKAGLFFLRISIDARDKETYEKLRRGLDFETVEYNIREAWKICNKMKKSMRAQMVKTKENQHDFANIVRYWKPYFHRINTSAEIPLVRNRRRLKPIALSCRKPWKQIMIRADGNVSFCCLDLAHEPMGNVYEQSMLEIFNSEKFNALRKRIIEGKDLPETCKRCRNVS